MPGTAPKVAIRFHSISLCAAARRPCLRAKELQQQAQYQNRSLSIEEARNQAASELGYATLESREAIADKEIQMRAQALQQDAQQFGRSMTLQEATAQAQQEIAREQMDLSRWQTEQSSCHFTWSAWSVSWGCTDRGRR